MKKITQRQIIGWFYEALKALTGAGWINVVSNYFTSDMDEEEYAWIGMVPQLREWIGGRQAKGLPEFDFKIKNKHFESTIEFLVKHLRRDKTGQTKIRISELARRTNTHFASLLSTLVVNGESDTCYDGQYFFDTDHEEHKSGTQSNNIDVDISALPVAVHGIVTEAAVAEYQLAIAKGVQQIVGFKDDQGEPVNEDASQFVVMCPVAHMNVAMQAVATPVQVAETQTALSALKKKFSIDVAPNARLDNAGWTDKFSLFRTDSAVKALIRQEETKAVLKVKGEGSEYEFDNDAHQYGVDTWRNVGFGDWKKACLVNLV